MSPDAQRLLEEARQLPADERDWLVETLLIKEEPEAEVAAAWDAEIKRRLDEIDSGKVKMISHEEFLASLESHIAKERQA